MLTFPFQKCDVDEFGKKNNISITLTSIIKMVATCNQDIQEYLMLIKKNVGLLLRMGIIGIMS